MFVENPIKFNTSVPFSLGRGQPLVLIAGPCVIESREHALKTAEKIKEITDKLNVPLIYKSSFDKANRTSLSSFRGPGIDEGLKILEQVRSEFSLPVVTDIHTREEATTAAAVVDVLQIPAFLCRQTDLISAAARTTKPLIVKKGQFLHPEDMRYVLEKAAESGAKQVMLCERGSSFGYRELIVDFRGLAMMRELSCPIVFDATHSVQIIGGAAGKSSGNRKFVPLLARAAAAVGIDALFVECHENPDRAPSDGANMLSLAQLESLLLDVLRIHELALETSDK